MRALFGVLILALAALALPGRRWRHARRAYVGFIALGLLYFPLKVGFALAPRGCNWDLGPASIRQGLQNHAHVVLFALFFLISRRQLAGEGATWRAGLLTLAMGAAVEAAQGVTGEGNCRLRDLIPDVVGAAAAALGVAMFERVKRPMRR